MVVDDHMVFVICIYWFRCQPVQIKYVSGKV